MPRPAHTYPEHVVSSTIGDEDLWQNTTVVRDDVVGAVWRLKELPGSELQVHGSRQLARSLHDAGLVDSYRLLCFPVVVGQGRKLFDDGTVPSAFRLSLEGVMEHMETWHFAYLSESTTAFVTDLICRFDATLLGQLTLRGLRRRLATS